MNRTEYELPEPTPAGPDCGCLDCRSEREFRPCRMPSGWWCANGWHWRKVETEFGYTVDTISHACPLTNRTHLQEVADAVASKEEEKTETLARKLKSDARIAAEADRRAFGRKA